MPMGDPFAQILRAIRSPLPGLEARAILVILRQMKPRRSLLPIGRPWSRIAPSIYVACVLGGMLIGNASAQVQFDKANDYFAARGSDRLAVVEQYHLGPCQQNYRNRDWARAVSECNFILRIFPNHPAALLLVTQVCEQWKSGACLLLDEFFERAIAVNPKAAGTYVVQGIYYSRTRNFPVAIERFKTAVDLDPNNMNAHYNLALAYLDSNQFELANLHAQRAYALGATPPGLRDRLKRAGHWKTVDTASSGTDGPAAPPSKASSGSR